MQKFPAIYPGRLGLEDAPKRTIVSLVFIDFVFCKVIFKYHANFSASIVNELFKKIKNKHK